MSSERIGEGTSLSKDLRINEMIRVPNVRVVDEDGSQLGVMPTFQALQTAQERGYDLVEVAPTAAPPVVKFLDYGQFKYEQARKEKEARRNQRSVEFKEIRLKPKIGKGDFDTKVRRADPVPGGRRPGEGHGAVPGPRGESRLHRAGPADTVRGRHQGTRHRRPAAAAGRQVDVHDGGLDTQTEDHPRRRRATEATPEEAPQPPAPAEPPPAVPAAGG